MIKRLFAVVGVLLLLAMAGPAPAQELVKKVDIGSLQQVGITFYISTEQTSVRVNVVCRGESSGYQLILDRNSPSHQIDYRGPSGCLVRGYFKLMSLRQGSSGASDNNFGVWADVQIGGPGIVGQDHFEGLMVQWRGPAAPQPPR
jgi:hypothetical protein